MERGLREASGLGMVCASQDVGFSRKVQHHCRSKADEKTEAR